MATRDEIRVMQANHYFALLSIRKQNEGYVVKGLQHAISQSKAGMLEPDIAWVEKQVAEAFS